MNRCFRLVVTVFLGRSDDFNVTVPPGPWKLKNPREPKVQVGVGIMKTTVNTEPTPEELFKVRWISAAHETRRNRQGLCGVLRAEWQEG